MALFDTIISRINKSMGGGKKDKGGSKQDVSQGTEAKGEEGEEEEEGEAVVEATEVIKALTEQVEALQTGQQELLKAMQQQAEQNDEFKKSMGEGMIALMDQAKQYTASPDPRRSVVSALDAMLKGGFGGGAVQAGEGGAVRHNQFTSADLDDAKEILCKAVADGKLTVLEATRAENQINKSIMNPLFQIDPKFVSILRGVQKA